MVYGYLRIGLTPFSMSLIYLSMSQYFPFLIWSKRKIRK